VKRINLVQLSSSLLNALADGDIEAANFSSPIQFGAYFVNPECRSTWRRRASQIAENPNVALWITRAIVDIDNDAVVGRAGFHGPPNTAGMVEIGYAVDPLFRRQGYARAALVALLNCARNHGSVQTVRATIRPDNHASLALVRQYGFAEVGEQWDDEDGLEIIFEVSADAD
jgi:RimJ/RimL family protein N-acetyltransferase